MAKRKVRIEIPADPSAALGLLGKVQTQHNVLGAASPLTGLKWEEVIEPAYDRALEQDGLADGFHQKAETATGERNKDMPTVMAAIRSARDVLVGIYAANPKKLIEFGFDVSDSHENPTAPPAGPSPTPGQ
jgi:hypothetical protein